MLDELLARYLREIETAVRLIRGGYVEHYEEEILETDRVNLRVRIRFEKGCLLEINEAVIVESGVIRHIGYRYHFQDHRNSLVFRYDNTPHFPDIRNFPHHKHLPDRVVETVKPSVLEVIEEARSSEQ